MFYCVRIIITVTCKCLRHAIKYLGLTRILLQKISSCDNDPAKPFTIRTNKYMAMWSFMSLLTRVPCVPACQRDLCPDVLACQHGLRANLPACQRAKSVPTSPS